MKQLIPLEDHVLIEPIEEEATTASGFILPTDNKEKPSKGKVVAAWKGKIMDSWERWPMDVKVWDVVYFTKYSPDELEVWQGEDKKNYLVVRHGSILAVEA